MQTAPQLYFSFSYPYPNDRIAMPLIGKNYFWLGAYELAWKAAMPALSRFPRLREGWSERLLKSGPADPVNIWIQAASGGEAYLALEIQEFLLRDGSVRGLITSGTTQGLRILKEKSVPSNSFRAAYFPFDRPSLMEEALARWRPKVLVLLETELWPGLLSLCRKKGVPVLILNGRLSEKSLKVYLSTKKIWRRAAPAEIHAISPEDARRYGTLFGADRVQVMNNIKFDRLKLDSSGPSGPLEWIVPEKSPFLVLGSIREEEEGDIEAVLKVITSISPETVTGLFPRHMHRLPAWKEILDRIGLRWLWRTEVTEPVLPGTVILWDRFGELDQSYARAWAVFVGGSLKPCGGQNFLEALGRGVVPCVGPHWENFSWVGREIVEMGLVREVKDRKELAKALAIDLLNPPDREETLRRVRSYMDERTGGTDQACRAIRRYF